MDQTNTSSSRLRRPSTKLHKDPPRFFSSGSLRKQKSSASLQRHPSAPVYPRFHAGVTSRDHLRTKSTQYGSSTSSIDQRSADPSPILPEHENNGSSTAYSSSQFHPAQSGGVSLADRGSDDLIGAPFDARGMLNALDSPQLSGRQNPPTRPPLHSPYTSPDPRTGSPALRQSASFNHGDPRMEKPPIHSYDGSTTPKRYSDEATGGKTGPFRKRTGFSSFVNSMLGSPRNNIKISSPENPVHVTHVGYDNQTGQFTVCLLVFVHLFLVLSYLASISRVKPTSDGHFLATLHSGMNCELTFFLTGPTKGLAADAPREWDIKERTRTTSADYGRHHEILREER